MRISARGIETRTAFFYWFDVIETPANRMIGYERYKYSHTAICFWWFCIIWGKKLK